MVTAKKGPVLRVTGLSASRADEELATSLKATINNELTDEEKANLNIKVDFVPSCYDDKEKVALLECCGGLPAFLSASAADSQGKWQIEMGDIDINFDQDFFGFTQLYTPASDTPVVADVIAITGLGGHAYGSWRGKGNLGRMWLRHFLCKDLPSCRTMIYGYNSKLLIHGSDTIMDYGRGLLEELRKVRSTEEQQRRPLFFIAHSFGGIILAHCLVKVAQTTDQKIASLLKATYGMLLFGIPHRGLVVDDFQKVLAGKDDHPRRQLLEQIQQKSDQLASQLDSFRNIIQDRKVVSFYETRQTRQLQFDSKTNRWARTGDFVTAVDSESALLQLPDSIEDKIPLDADHSMMVKFDDKDDQGCSSARGRLMQFAQDAPSVVANRFALAHNSPKPPIVVPKIRGSVCVGQEVAEFRTVEEAPQSTYKHNSERPTSPIAKRRKTEGTGDLETDATNQQKHPLAGQELEERASMTSAQLSQQSECLRSLSFLEQEHRFHDIHTAEHTCEWLFEHEGYQTWLKGNSGLFWIKGDPGAGKSVLMKHSVKRTLERSPEDLVVSFFFHGQGKPLQKTSLGLFRALLSSMLEHFPKHLAQLAAKFAEKEKRYGGFTGHAWEWTKNELKEALSNILSEGTHRRRVVIFIDALDECGADSAKSLIEYFDGLTRHAKSKHAQFKVCLSSRHYPILALDNIPSVQVEKMNGQDIRWYVRERLKDIQPESKREQIQAEILSKSNGGFQWVFLVTETIIDENLIGFKTEKLLEGPANCPKPLSKIYETILNGVPARDKNQMIKIFQWVLSAERPLSAQELRDALAADKDMGYKNLHDLRAKEFRTDTLVAFEKYVKHISGGLISFQTRDLWEQYERNEPDPDREAQLIHQSVADFLMEEFASLFGKHLPGAKSLIGTGHLQISRSCLRYMVLEDILEDAALSRGTLSSKYPLAPYAVRFLLAHIKKVEKEGITQSNLLSVMKWKPNSETIRKLATLWRTLDPNSTHMPLGWPFVGATALHVLVAFGSMSAVNSRLESGCEEFESRDANGNTPLMLAIRENHHDIALVLLDRIVDCESHHGQQAPDEECGVTPLSVAHATVINAQNNDSETALDFALEQNMGDVVVKLIEAGANLRYLGRETALVAHAVSNRNTNLLSILIEKKIKLDGAVFFAVKDQVAVHDPVLESIISQLLSAGANTARSSNLNAVPDIDEYYEEEENDGNYDTDALALASRRGFTNVAEMLLEHGAPAALQNDMGHCPMLIATEHGHEDIVRMILSRGPSSVETEDPRDDTALRWAIEDGQSRIIYLLLQKGEFSNLDIFLGSYFVEVLHAGDTTAIGIILQRKLVDPDIQDNHGRRPLSYAAQKGYEAVVKQLLDTDKVDPDAKDSNRYTPLLWAARSGHKAIVKQLLGTDKVDPNARNDSGFTPLLRATRHRNKAVVKQLLDTGKVNPNVKDRVGWTPLLHAVSEGYTEIVQLLLDSGKVDADAKAKNGLTPLSWAVQRGYKAIVKQLLDTGKVDPNAKDKDGSTPLSWARYKGSKTVLKLLLDTVARQEAVHTGHEPPS